MPQWRYLEKKHDYSLWTNEATTNHRDSYVSTFSLNFPSNLIIYHVETHSDAMTSIFFNGILNFKKWGTMHICGVYLFFSYGIFLETYIYNIWYMKIIYCINKYYTSIPKIKEHYLLYNSRSLLSRQSGLQ